MKRIATIIVGIFATLAFAAPAMADVPAGGYGDGKVPTVKAQKAACKPVAKKIGAKSATTKLCREVAKLPTYWVNIDGVNYQRVAGIKFIDLTVDMMPVCEWDAEFARAAQEFADAHAHIQV